MGKKKDASSAIGRSIIKSRQKNPRFGQPKSRHHTTDLDDGYDWNRINLNSVTEQNSLDEFLTTAELAGTEFTAEKLNITVVDSQTHQLPSIEEEKAIQKAQIDNKELLSIPRRPQWDSDTTASELEMRERDSFLNWRRQLASLQEKDHVVLTPFERNLEFWRQLWRVLERSDVVVQIVDARNPLLFRCEDLEKYVKEVSEEKENFILLSKADLLTQEQRDTWAEYFSEQGIRVAFWSAFHENARVKKEEGENSEGEPEDVDEEERTMETTPDSHPPVEMSNPFSHLEQAVDNLHLETEGEKEDKNDAVESSVTVLNDGSLAAPNRDMNSALDSNSPDEENSDLLNIHDEEFSNSLSNQQADGTHLQSDDLVASGSDMNKQVSKTEEAISGENKESSHESDGIDVNPDTEMQSKSSITQDGGEACVDSKIFSSNIESRTDSNEEKESHGLLRSKRTSKLNSGKLVTGDELLEMLRTAHSGKKVTEGITTVSMVGYPNVGKSSTINALLQQKKVPVSATPGRTKHFQTLFVEPTLCLCDCPGLVMPSFVSSKAEMVVNGILPVDQLRDFISPVSLICQIIPRRVLEKFYKIEIIKPKEGEDPDRPPTALEFLNAYAYNRGFMTQKGVPNSRRVALLVLKDFVSGRLLYRKPPPGISDEGFAAVCEPLVKDGYHDSKPNRPTITAEGTQERQMTSDSLDAVFFQEKNPTAHTKGQMGPRGLNKVDGFVVYTDQGPRQVPGKPWKKHHNKHKKEKLRRTYNHLDVK